MSISALVLGPDSKVGNMIGQALNITELGFSRKQETQADEFGLDMLNCYYSHIGGATDFFKHISKERKPSKFGHYFSTHPDNRKRMAHLNDLGRRKGYVIRAVSEKPKIFSKTKQ
jgi:predicted Zn-dependent protease